MLDPRMVIRDGRRVIGVAFESILTENLPVLSLPAEMDAIARRSAGGRPLRRRREMVLMSATDSCNGVLFQGGTASVPSHFSPSYSYSN
jgi:hypothetical protein